MADATSFARLIDAIPIVENATVRDALFPNPAINQRVHNLAVGYIERWDGLQWIEDIPTGVGGLIVDIRARGGKGDGSNDDGIAAQAAINDLLAFGGGTLLLPPAPSSYKFATTPVLNNTANISVVGYGLKSKITLSGAGTFAFKLTGANSGLRFRRFAIAGSNNVTDNQTGIGTIVNPPAGTLTTDITFEDIDVGFTSRGIYVDVATKDDARSVRCIRGFIHDILGIVSGSGYGFVASGAVDVLVDGTNFEKVQRHSCYISVSHLVRIVAPHFRKHRNGVALNDGTRLPALEIARCYDVTVIAPVFEACEDCAMAVEPSEDPTHLDSKNIVIVAPVFRDSTTYDLALGTNTAPTKRLSDVRVIAPTVRRAASASNNFSSIIIFNGKDIRIVEPDFSAENLYTVAWAAIYLPGVGGATETDDITVTGGGGSASAAGGSASLVELGAVICGGTQTVSVRNAKLRVIAGTVRLMTYDATLTNPNVTVQSAARAVVTQLDGWYQENVVASQTNVALTRLATTTDAPTAWIALRPGSVTGICIHANAPRSAGTLTAKVFKNGTLLGLMTAVLDGTNTTFKATTQPEEIDTFVAGDQLEVKITTDAGWLPVTADVRASIEVKT